MEFGDGEATDCVMNYTCITTDLWTAQHQNRSYISVTAHFIDDNWKLQTRCLETHEVSTANNLADELGKILIGTLLVT